VLVLFDQGTPAPLRQTLAGHQVHTAYERGWSTLRNGEFLAAAEAAGYQVLVSTDRNLKFQQNLAARSIGIVVLLTTSWPRIQRKVGAVVEAVNAAEPGSYVEVSFDDMR
jgi:hypothetical protein